MRYQIMSSGASGQGETIVAEGRVGTRRQMLDIATNIFATSPWHWIVDENGYIVENAEQARGHWGRTAIEEMREALDDKRT